MFSPTYSYLPKTGTPNDHQQGTATTTDAIILPANSDRLFFAITNFAIVFEDQLIIAYGSAASLTNGEIIGAGATYYQDFPDQAQAEIHIISRSLNSIPFSYREVIA